MKETDPTLTSLHNANLMLDMGKGMGDHFQKARCWKAVITGSEE